jgi:hypothetical protein
MGCFPEENRLKTMSAVHGQHRRSVYTHSIDWWFSGPTRGGGMCANVDIRSARLTYLVMLATAVKAQASAKQLLRLVGDWRVPD